MKKFKNFYGNRLLKKWLMTLILATTPIFLPIGKKYGTYKTILNLKKFSEYCTTEHFKMESIKNVINTLKPSMFLASIDIKDPFYSVLIFPTIHLERENL